MTADENFSLYRVKLVYPAKKLASSEQLSGENIKELLSYLIEYFDQIDFEVKASSLDAVNFSTLGFFNIEEKIEEISDSYGFMEDNEELIVEVKFSKMKDSLHIVNAEVFYSYLDSLNIYEQISKWKNFLNSTIYCWDIDQVYTTTAFSFVPMSKELVHSEKKFTKERVKRIENRDSICHFSNASEINLVPNDFHSIDNEFIFSPQLIRLRNALTICFMANSSEIKNNIICYKLNGYKTLKGEVEGNRLGEIGFDTLYKMYEWIYDGSNSCDKLGLVRNLLTLHVGNKDHFNIDSSILTSMYASYDIYLKDNVHDYLEAKKKATEFLQSQAEKATEITNKIFSSFKSSFWSLSTFFVSIFLFRALSSRALSGQESEVVIAGVLLTFLSFMYLVFSVWEVNVDKSRWKNAFHDIEKRYKEILDPNDLKNTLDSAEVIRSEMKFIRKKRDSYVLIWSLFNVAFLVTIYVLFKK